MSEYIVNMSGNWSGKLTEIVRCRDCKHMEENEYCICMLPDGIGGRAYWFVNPNGFCAWGERKENGR